MRWLAGLLGWVVLAPLLPAAEWQGYVREDFTVAGRPCILVQPHQPAAGDPWIWRTEFFGAYPPVDLALLARGWRVAYMNAKDMYGAPKAMALFDAFYRELTSAHGLSRRMVLEGFSRGGLYAFNYAALHPERVAALYLDAPVLDIRSWPGSDPRSKEWKQCLAIYGLTPETARTFHGNPLDHIAPVARAHIPIIVVCGGADTLVPMAQNASILERRYRALGGTIEVIVKPGVGHHPHSLANPAPIVDFLLSHDQSGFAMHAGYGPAGSAPASPPAGGGGSVR